MGDSHEYLENIIQSIADPIFVKDRKHRWVYVNDAFCRFMGYPRFQVLGKSDYDYFPKEQADVFWQKDEEVFSSGKENVNEEKFTDAQGKTHTIMTKKARYSDHAGEQFIVGIIRDVTELRESHQQASQAQKAEAIAAITSNVAHDMNNQLTPVIGYLDLVLHELPPTSPVRDLILEAHQAALRCSETVGRLKDIGETSAQETPSGETTARKGHELILLADDEESVRKLGQTLLQRLGYQVILATDGIEALELYRSNRSVALVILDMMMPRMDGSQTLQKILEINPSARVVISSGYMKEFKPEHFIQSGAKGFLKKPYLLDPLAKLVRQTLDS